MASKRMDLNKRCFFVLSGLSNELGKVLALEFCRRFKAGSVVMLVDTSPDDSGTMREASDAIKALGNGIAVLTSNCLPTADLQQLIADALGTYPSDGFELAFILHNEGYAATRNLIEPQEQHAWRAYAKEQVLYAIQLNQAFVQEPQLQHVTKLVVNITSSLAVKPFMYGERVLCSCKDARDSYFRAMAAEERHLKNDIQVLTYSPGILLSHEGVHVDENNNEITLPIEESKKMRAQPIEATLKLINILEELSFISGHDVDYYDTYCL